jgi:hypothetical protein
LQEQGTLTNGKVRLGADPEKLRCFVFETVVMISRQPIERSPLLPVMTNKLPLIFADWATSRWVSRLIKLRSALHADKVLHGV